MSKEYLKFDLQLLANPNTNTTADTTATTGNDLSATMKIFYDTSLLENSRAQLYFNQFGKKQPLPKNRGNKVEWRKFSTFDKALTPLTEGVTPDGNKVTITRIESPIAQYGDYTTISDRLELEAVDPIIMGVTEEHGAQAGETLDTITRNEVLTGTQVIYGGSGITSRAGLTSSATLTPTLVNQAVTLLKKMKAPQADGGGYIAIVHPSCTYDLRQSSDWIDVHKYAQPEEIYNGEIGKLHNVRFIESTEQKVYKGAPLTAAAANLSVKTAITTGTTTVAVKEAISSAEATALVGREILLGTVKAKIASAYAAAAGSATLTTAANVENIAADTVIYPGEAGAANAAVYAVTVFGKDAYGIIEPSAESLEVIVKQRGSAGTSDPLDQRSTVGWKASHAAKILYQERLVRLEVGSFYSDKDEAN